MRKNAPRPSAPRLFVPRSIPRRLREEHDLTVESGLRCYCGECRQRRPAPPDITPERRAERRARIEAFRPKREAWRALNLLDDGRAMIQRKKEEQVFKAGLALRGRE